MDKAVFEQELYNKLSTIFTKSLGNAMDARQIDRLNLDAKSLADLISKQVNEVARDQSLAVCKILNDTVKEAFQMAYKDIADIKAQLPPKE